MYPNDSPSVNPGFVLGQLARAFVASQSGADAEARARAARKLQIWTEVFEGLLAGTLKVGARQPVEHAPVWATLQVAYGGFATGRMLAAGELLPHEHTLAARLTPGHAGAERAALNSYYLTEMGVRDLQGLLDNGLYRITVPEEGALLAAAWLVRQGDAETARALLDEIGPYMNQLRFYPVPAGSAVPAGEAVCVWTVGDVRRRLQAVRVRPEVERQAETLTVWTPLYDRALALFAQTVVGAPPAMRVDAQGKLVQTEAGKRLIEGGWPCQQYPPEWRARAQAWLGDFAQARADHKLCRRAHAARGNLVRLQVYLSVCVEDPRKLTGREVGMVRAILAGAWARRGAPEGALCQAQRAKHAQQVTLPTSVDFARVVDARLAAYAADEGLSAPEVLLGPLSAAEGRTIPDTPAPALDTPDTAGGAAAGGAMERAPAQWTPAWEGRAIPAGLRGVVRRALSAPIETLVAGKLVRSGEMLARVIPQITAQVSVAGVSDPALRRLLQAVYEAFRRRRSVLLFNLESQVKLEELPWVLALLTHVPSDAHTQTRAREMFARVAALAVSAFPEQLVPNKLVREFKTLAHSAALDLPLVEELAADIFMGEFTDSFVHAAQSAGALLAGTLYARYYEIPYDDIRRINDFQPSRYGPQISPTFTALCKARAHSGEGVRTARHWSPADNGKIIEQAQILTTHNLAVLFHALGLVEGLRPRLGELARQCFVWICARQQKKFPLWLTQLRALKNCAYAWRHMLFFLALQSDAEVAEFVAWAQAHVAAQPEAFRVRFAPALAGLVHAAHAEGRGGAPCFVGWTTERHWLLVA